MFKRMLTNGTGRIVLFALVFLAPSVPNTAFGQALNMDGPIRHFLPALGPRSYRPPSPVRCANCELSRGECRSSCRAI